MTDTRNPTPTKRTQNKAFGRNPKAQDTVGVELGYGVLRLILLKQAGDGRILLKKCHSVEFDPSWDYGSATFGALLKTELKQFCSGHRDAVIWTMPPPSKTNIINIRIPQVSASRLPGAVYWGLQRKESFLENETVVDFQVENESSTGATLDVSCALVNRASIESIQQTFSQAGFPLAGIGAPLFSLQNLVNLRQAGQTSGPALICQMGQKATSVSVLDDGQIVFSRSIPLGLESLAEALVRDLEPAPSHEEARHLILKPGVRGALSDAAVQQQELVPGLLLPVLERLVRQIERTIEHYQTNFDTEPLELTFVGGELAARPHLFNFISKRLSSKVIQIDPFDSPGLQNLGNMPGNSVDRIGSGPAFGLALEAGKGGINLAHTYKDRQQDAKLVKISTLATLVMILLTAFTAFIYTTKWKELRGLESDKKKFEAKLKTLGPTITETSINQASEEVGLLQDQRRAASKRYESLALLSEISKFTPENITLLHVSAKMEGPPEVLDTPGSSKKPGKSSKPDVEDGTLTIKGVVNGERADLETTLTLYVKLLGDSELFKNVAVASTEIVQTPDALSLTFTLEVRTKGASNKAITRK